MGTRASGHWCLTIDQARASHLFQMPVSMRSLVLITAYDTSLVLDITWTRQYIFPLCE